MEWIALGGAALGAAGKIFGGGGPAQPNVSRADSGASGTTGPFTIGGGIGAGIPGWGWVVIVLGAVWMLSRSR